jgi:putative ABC transport system permease protein
LVAASKVDLEITLTLGNILLGLFISVLIGIVSGIFPSYKAAKLNPVEAINTTF